MLVVYIYTCLQMALKFLEGAARDGFAAANALIGKVTPHCFASYADSLCSVYLVQLLCCWLEQLNDYVGESLSGFLLGFLMQSLALSINTC